jgi:hypothetical protein
MCPVNDGRAWLDKPMAMLAGDALPPARTFDERDTSAVVRARKAN